jgi:hypothetical protein
MQAELHSQGMRHVYALGVEVSTNGVDPLATFNAHLIANGGKDLVTPDGGLHDDDPQVREAVINYGQLARTVRAFWVCATPRNVRPGRSRAGANAGGLRRVRARDDPRAHPRRPARGAHEGPRTGGQTQRRRRTISGSSNLPQNLPAIMSRVLAEARLGV